jgi:tetratricopeptide (TPR) repeat protein
MSENNNKIVNSNLFIYRLIFIACLLCSNSINYAYASTGSSLNYDDASVDNNSLTVEFNPNNPVNLFFNKIIVGIKKNSFNDENIGQNTGNRIAKDNIAVKSVVAAPIIASSNKNQTLNINSIEKTSYDAVKAQYGENDARTLFSLNAYAQKLVSNGDHRSAIKLFDKALNIAIQSNGLNNLDTLSIMNNYALTVLNAGIIKPSIPYLDKVRKGKEALLGIGNEDTILAFNNYAHALKLAGKYSESSKIFKQILDSSVKILGEKNAATLHIMNNYAGSLEAIGNLKDALNIYEKTLRLRIDLLGYDNVDTLISFNNYGYILEKMGKYDLAKTQFDNALRSKQFLGQKHPLTLQFKNNSAVNLEDGGDFKNALPIYEEVLKQRIDVSGELHPDTLLAYHNYANSLRNNKQDEEAVPYYEKAYKSALNTFGDVHPQTLTYLESYVNGLKNAGYSADYVSYQQKMTKMKADVDVLTGYAQSYIAEFSKNNSLLNRLVIKKSILQSKYPILKLSARSKNKSKIKEMTIDSSLKSNISSKAASLYKKTKQKNQNIIININSRR